MSPRAAAIDLSMNGRTEAMNEAPGSKERGGYSNAAALAVASRACQLREETFDYISSHPDLTADEIAAGMDRSPWAIRPRVSELRKEGRVISSGRGRNPSSGLSANLWRAAGAA
jgi:hypothetical protein